MMSTLRIAGKPDQLLEIIEEPPQSGGSSIIQVILYLTDPYSFFWSIFRGLALAITIAICYVKYNI
jgi:hypothetical protein